jgi:hypothetical protein
MITVSGNQTIRTSRNIKGYRSCNHSVGEDLGHVEDSRLALEQKRLGNRVRHNDWAVHEWLSHFEKVGGWQCVLPPSARK